MVRTFAFVLLAGVRSCGAVESESPIKDRIEKVFCEVASNKEIEDKAVSAICQKISEKLHIPDSLCQEALEKGWEKLVAKCPKGLESTLPPKIEKLVCAVASKKEIEDKAVGAICQKISEKVHIPDNMCQEVLEKGWDKIVSKCPHGLESSLPPKIEKLVCEMASQKEIEDKAVGAICQKISEKVHIPDNMCQEVLEKGWDKIVSKCPKGLESSLPPKIEKLVCEMASQKEIEDKAVGAVCQKISEKAHIPDNLCQEVLEKGWDKIVSKCPKQNTIVV